MIDQRNIKGINELVLEVADLERSERFYGKLGLPVVERWPKRNAVWLRAGATRMGLWLPQEGLEGSQGGVHVHFAIEIAPAAFDAQLAALRAEGFEAPVHEFPASDGFRVASRSAYVTDPDGHLVEFWTASVAEAYS